MHGNGASPYVWNELHRPAEGYDRDKWRVCGKSQISSGIPGNIRHVEKGVPVPDLEVSRKRPLADDGYQKPQLGCCF